MQWFCGPYRVDFSFVKTGSCACTYHWNDDLTHSSYINSWHTLKCSAYDISYGQKRDINKWISQKNNSNQFQDNISNNILRQNPKIQIFLISGINGIRRFWCTPTHMQSKPGSDYSEALTSEEGFLQNFCTFEAWILLSSNVWLNNGRM